MAGDCVACHMQKSGTSDIPHVLFTDHWIRRTLPSSRRPSDIERDLVRTEPFQLVRMTDAQTTPSSKADLEEAIAYFAFYETRHKLPTYLRRVSDSARRGLAQGADHQDARLAWGKVLVAMDSLATAERVFTDATSAYPENALLHLGLGIARLEAGHPDAALEPLRQALSIQPLLLEARLRLAEAYETLGRMSEAESAYKVMLDQDPIHHPNVWNNLGFFVFAAAACGGGRGDVRHGNIAGS
jgi:tetratricopeptide (TPR) repeat protein